MPHSFVRRPEDALTETKEARRRWMIVVLVLVTLAGLGFAWHRLGPYLRTTPQPTEPRRISVFGEDRLVSMELWRSGTMSSSPPFTVAICTDGTIVCEIEDLRPTPPRIVRRTDRATPEQLARLESAFAAADFARLRTDYSRADFTDAPWYTVYRYDGARPRLVSLYGGDRSVPEALHHLIGEFFLALDLRRWIPAYGRDLPESPETR